MSRRLLVRAPVGDDGTAYNAAKTAMGNGTVFGVAVELLWAEDDSGYLFVETPDRAGMLVLLAEAETRGYRVSDKANHQGTATYRDEFVGAPMTTAQGMALMAEALIAAGHVTRAQVIAAIESYIGAGP